MQDWQIVENLEKEIILELSKAPKTITKLAKNLNKNKGSISKVVSKLLHEETLKDFLDEGERIVVMASRKKTLYLNNDLIKVEKTLKSYKRYIGLIFLNMMFAGGYFWYTKEPKIIFSSSVILISLIAIFFIEVMDKQDVTLVFKKLP